MIHTPTLMAILRIVTLCAIPVDKLPLQEAKMAVFIFCFGAALCVLVAGQNSAICGLGFGVSALGSFRDCAASRTESSSFGCPATISV